MHPDKVPLAFGIKIAPHHTPFTIPGDWHGFISVSLISGLIWEIILWKVLIANL